MRDGKASLVCTAGLLLLGVSGPAQSPPSEDIQAIIRLSQAQLASYGSWHADATLVEVEGGQELRYKGTVDYQAPYLLREQVVMTEPSPGGRTSLAVTGLDGINWREERLENGSRVLKITLKGAQRKLENSTIFGIKIDPEGRLPLRMTCGLNSTEYEYRVVRTEKLHEQPVYVLEGHLRADLAAAYGSLPEGSRRGLHRVYLGTIDGFVHKAQQFFRDSDRLVRTVQFENLEFNKRLPETLFAYQPPPSLPVIDLNAQFDKVDRKSSP
jgi:outer membrane lipoprotein-sorting protein